MSNITNNLGSFAAAFDWTTEQSLADQMMGIGAELTGQPYDVYRVTGSSNGDVIQNANKIFTGYKIVREKYKPGKGALNRLETDSAFTAYWYSVRGDMSPMLTGDIFVQHDTVYGAGSTAVTYVTDQINAICLGEHAPGAISVGARVDRLIQVYRVPDAPVGGIWNQTQDGSLSLKCTAGAWGLGTNNTGASLIPAGFMPEKRNHGQIYTNVGDVPAKTTVKIYVMPLKGFRFREGDIIVAADKSRYRVVNPYYQETGAVGNQLLVERDVAND